MSRTRDLVALSTILLAPLGVLLLAQSRAPAEVEAAPVVAAPDVVTAPVVAAPVLVAAPEPVVAAPVVVEPTVSVVAEPVVAEPALSAPEAPEPAPGRDPGQAMLLYKDALVLASEANPAWASGRISTVAEPGYLRATRAVRWDSLPAPARTLEAARVVVYAADGSACVATVGAPRLQLERAGDVFPADEDGEVFEGYDPPANKAVLRNMVKEEFASADDLLLLANQRSEDGRACQGEWARRADLPAPVVFGKRALARDEARVLRAATLDVLREQPEYAELRAEYAEYAADLSDDVRDDWPGWDAFVTARLSLTRWDEVGGPRRIVSLELRGDPEPCSSDFAAGFSLLLEQQGERLVRLTQSSWFDITALMDVDGDGVLEAVTGSDHDSRTLAAEGANADALRDSFGIAFFGCPC